MFAFLKGIGGYIGGTVVGKVIVVAVAAGTIATGGIVAANQPHMSANVVESESMSISDVSTIPSSSTATIDSSSAVSTVSQTSSAETSQAQLVAVDSSTGAIVLPAHGATEGYYAVINPDTGDPVPTTDTNYVTCRAALGGDAGTVDPAKSTAVAAAMAKIAVAKADAAKAEIASEIAKVAAQSAAQAALSSSTAN